MPDRKAPRVAVVGARRARQGIGAFVARAFHAAGARVVAISTRTAETAREAVGALRDAWGIEARGFDSVERMLDEVPVDIVAICSPTRLHRLHLERVARFPVDVLCEKPLWWDEAADLDREAARLLDALGDRRIRLLTQWPYTLAAFEALHGPVGEVRRIEMRLSPVSEGLEMLPDAAPHLISMLQATVGLHEARAVAWDGPGRVTFEYGPASVHFEMIRHLERPRPAWYALDGRRVERTIRLPMYSFEFNGGGRTVQAEDPLDLLIRDFLTGSPAGAEAIRRAIRHGMALLGRLRDSASR